ncbi:IS3 family transposase [Actinobacillus equuli subsp. equuli]|uniref:IS3 family transposase n=1 Tax=Actinobacillus equuli subsp. equuli TaxID=202947 RepID=A0A9X4G3E5_ACTEU|nr:IS3 family transposase [Actinobacillus equuli]MDE8033565.1 IS3 family transposase [Actinobacillus equuli subsp. equuli]
MTKYNQFFKQQVIDFYFENHESLAKTYHHFSLSRTLVNRWIEQFKHAGVDALIIRRTKQKYSTEFKLMVVQAVLHSQFTGEEATLHFGLPNSSLVSQWLKAFEKQGIQVRSKKCRKYRSYKGDVGTKAPNLLNRHFTAQKPNEKWLTDVTEFKAEDGNKLYFSPILDTFNNKLVAGVCSRSPNWAMVEKMLKQAIETLPKGAKPILHSDQGWHYQMRAYHQILAENDIKASMSRKGNCLDNAAMESFFGRLKVECFYGKRFKTVGEIERAVMDYVRYYNEERIQLKLNGLSPIQYQNQSIMIK